MKTRNNGRWTEARFRSFIVSALRQAHAKWGVKHDVKSAARVARGVYQVCQMRQRLSRYTTTARRKEA